MILIHYGLNGDGKKFQGKDIAVVSINNAAVTIGRALQPFPRSKRSGPLSRHSAFQLGRSTWRPRMRSKLPEAATMKQVHPNPYVLPKSIRLRSSDLPWRTFTMSVPLQDGVGLLRRLHPLFAVLAFSHPTVWVNACESSRIPKQTVFASRSCLLYAGWDTGAIHTCGRSQGDTHHTVLVRAYQPVSPFKIHDASDTGFLRQHRRQDWLPFRWTGSQIGFVVSGLPTPQRATLRRRPLSLLVIDQTRFSMNNSLSCETAHSTRFCVT